MAPFHDQGGSLEKGYPIRRGLKSSSGSLKSMTSLVRRMTHEYAPIGLLWAGILLQGAKTPLTFFIWGTLAVFLCLSTFRPSHQNTVKTFDWKEGILLLSILIAQLFSVDPSVSLLKSLQALIFLLLWVTFKSETVFLPDERPLRIS